MGYNRGKLTWKILMTDREKQDVLAGAVARVLAGKFAITPDQAQMISLALGFCSGSQVLEQAKRLKANPWMRDRWLTVQPQSTSSYLFVE
jgi:hypothetical protein